VELFNAKYILIFFKNHVTSKGVITLTTYETLDNYTDLTVDQMAGAVVLSLEPYENHHKWDNNVLVGPGTHGSILGIPNPLYRFNATEGTTYDIFVRSFGDPFVLIYDSQGNAITENDESDDLNPAQDIVWDWVAPYTGAYYINSGWQHDETSRFSYFSLSIYEDVDTAASSNINDGATQSSAQIHLATYGVTVQQAKDFVFSHVDQPEIIFSIAKQYGVTTPMLSDITNFSMDAIANFFASFGMNTDELNGIVPVNTPTSGHKLLPENLASLGNLIVFNTNSGVLSTDSLSGRVFGNSYEPDYAEVFDPKNYQGASDGVFTAEELGVAHLENLPATAGTLESLIYGTMINAFRAIDEPEIIQIVAYLNAHPDPTDNTVTSEFTMLMNDVFGDPSSDPVFRDDEQLANAVVHLVSDTLIDDIIRNDFNDILITSLVNVTAVSTLELIGSNRTDVFVDSGGVFL